MYIRNCHYTEQQDNCWNMEQINFNQMNLLIGQSGVGKTRLLNTISNLDRMIRGENRIIGHWTITFSLNDIDDTDIYTWEIELLNTKIIYEILECNGNAVILRKDGSFKFENNELPKLSLTQSALTLLSNEDRIKEININFKKIIRRNFFNGEVEQQCALSSFDEVEIVKDKNYNILDGLTTDNSQLPMSLRLLIWKKNDESKWLKIKSTFLEFFPNFSDLIIQSNNQGANVQKQIFAIEGDEKIILNDLSSGIQKALLIISDLVTMQKNSIYIMDEIENSLGNNILDNIIEFFYEFTDEIQFIITSHHPYIINHIPYKDWQLITKTGKKVSVKTGKELSTDFNLSKHDAYIKLQNMMM